MSQAKVENELSLIWPRVLDSLQSFTDSDKWFLKKVALRVFISQKTEDFILQALWILIFAYILCSSDDFNLYFYSVFVPTNLMFLLDWPFRQQRVWRREHRSSYWFLPVTRWRWKQLVKVIGDDQSCVSSNIFEYNSLIYTYLNKLC